MENKVLNFINKNNLLKPNQKVVLAFSYGVDSRVCLDVLLKLGYEVVLAHVNHKHRVESEIEEQKTKELAQALNIKAYVMHLVEDHNKNFHDDAHDKRYDFFKDVARKENTDTIVTSHHLNDNLENILLNLIKGSNLYGYSGIAPLVNKDGFKIVRPFLCVLKEDIYKYEEDHNLFHFEDKTNNENEFRRNRIRHNVVPLLKDENPNIFNQAYEYSSQVREAFNFIRKNTINYLNGKQVIDINTFKDLDTAVKKDIICFLLEQKKLPRNFNKINDILCILLNKKPQISYDINEEFEFIKRYNNAFIQKKGTFAEEYYKININDVIYTKNLRFYFTKKLPSNNEKYIKLCYNELVFPLILRNRRNGDTIKIKNGTKKIKDLFIDLKLTHEQRNEALLLVNNNEILGVINYYKSDTLSKMKNGDIYLVYEVLK